MAPMTYSARQPPGRMSMGAKMPDANPAPRKYSAISVLLAQPRAFAVISSATTTKHSISSA